MTEFNEDSYGHYAIGLQSIIIVYVFRHLVIPARRYPNFMKCNYVVIAQNHLGMRINNLT
jgi:hypothetical protein